MRNLAILFFIVPSACCFAQLQGSDKTLAGTIEYVDFQHFSPKYAYGLSGEYMLGDHIGVEFSVAGGKDYFHLGTGAVLFPIALLLSDNDSEGGDNFLIFLVGIASLFEHMNYHIPINKNIELVPYVSLLKIRYIYQPDSGFKEDLFASWSLGTKLGFRFNNNLFINATVEGSQLYYSGRPRGIQTGIQLGYIFKDKNKEDQ